MSDVNNKSENRTLVEKTDNNPPVAKTEKTSKRRKRKNRASLPKEIIGNLSAKRSKFSTSEEFLLEGETKECLLDSGAQTSFISEQYANERRFKREKVESKKNWVSANGSQIQKAGQATLNQGLGGKQFLATFIIAKGLSHDVIVGTDILRKNKCVLNFDKKELQCGKETIPINPISELPSKTVSATTVLKLEPFSKEFVKIKLTNKMPDLLYVSQAGGSRSQNP